MLPSPPRALSPCSPGEEQVGFILEVEIEVGDVVLLGALLLLAVTETPAEHRVSTSRGVIFFWGVQEAHGEGPNFCFMAKAQREAILLPFMSPRP